MKFYLVGKERVEILQRFPHTFLVKFVKTGKVSDIKREYVRPWSPKPYVKKDKSDKKQTKFNF